MCLLRLSYLLTTASLAAAVTLHAQSYGISKSASFMQSSAAPPLSTAWTFSAHLYASAPGEITTATIDTPTGQQLTDSGDRFLFFSSPSYPSQAALDAAFPNGLYAFTITAGTLAPSSASVSFPAEIEFPSAVPSFNRETIEALESYDACKSFGFTWNTFVPHPGTSGYRGDFSIRPAAGFGPQVFSSSVDGTNSATVPGGTLQPNTAYRVALRFVNESRTANAGFGDSDSVVRFSYSTTLEFTTLPEKQREGLSIRHSQVELCWPTASNTLYQMQYRSSLTTNRWVDLGAPIRGDGTCQCVYEDVPQGRPLRIYRVVTTRQ